MAIKDEHIFGGGGGGALGMWGKELTLPLFLSSPSVFVNTIKAAHFGKFG